MPLQTYARTGHVGTRLLDGLTEQIIHPFGSLMRLPRHFEVIGQGYLK